MVVVREAAGGMVKEGSGQDQLLTAQAWGRPDTYSPAYLPEPHRGALKFF